MRLLLLSYLLCYLQFHVLEGAIVTSPAKRVLIVGAGPAGLLTAHCLLSRPASSPYHVRIIEARPPPQEEGKGPRAYSLGINIRGQHALRHFDTPSRSKGLLESVKATGVPTDSFFLHIGSKSIALRKPAPPSQSSDIPATILLPRNKLCEAMLTSLKERYGDETERLKISYSTPLDSLDLNAKTAFFGNESFNYDLVIGADGVQSKVRQAMFNSPTSSSSPASPLICEELTLPGEFKVMVQPFMPAKLEPSSVHLLAPTKTSDFGLFVLPGRNQSSSCTLINWSTGKMPSFLDSNASVEDIQRNIESAFPTYGPVSAMAAEQLKLQRPSVAKTIRCNTYSDGDRGVLLLGDAAHSTGETRNYMFILPFIVSRLGLLFLRGDIGPGSQLGALGCFGAGFLA